MLEVKKMDYSVRMLHPDIATETWATDNIGNGELGIVGYKMFRCDRPLATRGRGFLLYVNEILRAKSVEISHEFPEHIWCQINSSVNTKLSNLLLGAVCRQNS